VCVCVCVVCVVWCGVVCVCSVCVCVVSIRVQLDRQIVNIMPSYSEGHTRGKHIQVIESQPKVLAKLNSLYPKSKCDLQT